MKTKCLLSILLVISCLAIFSTADQPTTTNNPATINFISTNEGSQSDALRTGSLAGGNTLYLGGIGIKKQFTSLTITIGGVNCPVLINSVSETRAACTVPAGAVGKKDIVFTQDGVIAKCDASICWYKYDASQTPIYEYLVPNALVGDRALRAGGMTRVTKSNSLDLKFSQYICNFATFGNQDLVADSTSFAKCKIGNIPAGYYQSSFKITGPGDAVKKTGLTSILGTDNTLYDLVVVPEITSVSSNNGPPNGNLITIKGSGFSNSKEETIVQVEGQICEIKESNVNQIKCSLKNTVPSTVPAGTLRPGHGGLTQRLFSTQTLAALTANNAFKNGGGSKVDYPSFEIPYNDRDDYTYALEGFFKASATGDHVFYLAANGPAELYISRTPLVNSNLEKIAYIQTSSRLRNYYSPSEGNQISSAISLQKDQYYYIRAIHVAKDAEHLSVAVSVPNNQPSSSSQPEIVSVKLQADVTRLEMIATITNTTASIQVAVLSGTTVLKSTTSFTFATSADNIVAALSNVGIDAKLLSTTYIDKSGNVVPIAQSTKVQHRLRFYTASTLKNKPGFTDASRGGFAQASDNVPTDLVAGTYKIAFGSKSFTFDFDTSTKDMEDALNSAYNTQSAFKVYSYGRAEEGLEYIIYFDRSLGNIPDGSVVQNGLTGGASGVNIVFTVKQQYSNNLFINPISPDYLYTAETAPQITVTSMGFRALCSGNCDYNTVATTSGVPTIVGFTWTDLSLTIDLQNVDTISDVKKFTSIWFAGNNAASCTWDKDAQRLTCTLVANSDGTPQVISGNFIPEVYVDGKGYAVNHPSVIPAAIAPVVSNIVTQPASTGFLQFVLTGAHYGFSTSSSNNYGTTVKIGGVNCVISALSNNQLTCSAKFLITSGPLVITVNKITTTVPFDNHAPEITVEPNEDCYLDIKGTFTDSTTFSLVNTATKVSNTCRACLRNTTFVRCRTCGLPPGPYNAVATTLKSGKTYESSTYPFTIKYYIDSVTPQIGSQLGGTVVTIKGWGFSDTLNENQVAIGCKDGCQTLRCDVISSSLTQLTCITQPNLVGLVGPQDLQAFVNLEFGSNCNGNNCNFQFSDNYTPQIYGTSALIIKSGDQLVLTGKLLSTSSIITIDGLVAPVLSVNKANAPEISITVQVPAITAQSLLTFTASDPVYGNYLIDSSIAFASEVVLTDISPKTGSKGGAILTLTGSGFTKDATVTVGTVACTIIEVTSLQIVCQAGNNANGAISVTQGTFKGVKCDKCVYTQSADLTPSVSGVAVDTTPGAFQITITGTKLNADTPINIKLVSDKITQSTNVISSTATKIVVGITNPIPGIYTLDARLGLNVVQYTKAGLTSITVPFTQTSDAVPTTTVSQAGGSDLSLLFNQITLPQDTSLLSVKIAGFDCIPSYIGSSNLVCTIPPLVTPTLKKFSEETWLTGAYISSSTKENPSLCFDDNTGTTFSGAVTDCWVGLDFGRDLKAEISQIQYFPKTGLDVTQLLGGVFEGSNDGTTYTLIKTLSGNIYSGYNILPFASGSRPTYRFVRFRRAAATNQKCELAEINFKGTLLTSVSIANTDTVSINNAVVTINGLTVDTIVANIKYSKTSTPTVTSITPKVGSSVGGTVVTIKGTGFSTVITDTTVYIDDTVCAVNTVSATQITCTTGPLPEISARTSRLTGKIDVKTKGKGSAVTTGITFLYAEKWSDPKTWGCGGLPIEGDSIHVPIGMNLLVDVDFRTPSVPKFVAVVVEGSLIFDDINNEFQAEYIMIRNGIMRIGTEDEPFKSNLKIKMNGLPDDEQLPIFGNKAIALYEGLIDIHGQPRTLSSTTLSVNANAGDKTITVDSIGDWKVGDEIAISSTSLDPSENELKKIKKIKGTVITLDSALDYTHISEKETITVEGQTQTIAVKAIVAVLTRNVVIQGNEDDSRETSYGATMLFYDPGTENTVVRIENAEFTYVGQAAYLERHPLNFLNTDNQINSYVKGCSIHKSFHKGIQVKGTQYLTISNNVFFDIPNEAIILPDGSEKNNVIEDNVIIQITASMYIFNSYNTPPAIYLSNPLNFVRRNKIAGVMNNGFTLTFNTAAKGASWSNTICPQGEMLGAFEDNSVLSCGATGLFIDSYYPRTLACRGYRANPTTGNDPFVSNKPVPATYKNFIAIRSNNGFQAWNLGAVVLDGFKISDSKSGAIEVRHAINSPIGSTQVTNAFLVGNLQLPTGTVTVNNYWGINVPSDDGFTVDTVSFAHFGSSASALLGCSNCANAWEKTGSRVTFLKSTKWSDVSKRVGFTAPYTHIFRDLDGSLTQTSDKKGATVVYNLPHMNVPECKANADVYSGLICDSSLEVRGLNFWYVNPGYVQGKTMRILRLVQDKQIEQYSADDYTKTTYRYPFTGYSCPFPTGYPYRVFFDVGLDFDNLQLETSPLYVPEDRPTHITFNYTEPREQFEVLRTTFLKNVANITNTTVQWNQYAYSDYAPKEFGDFYNDVENKNLYFTVTGNEVGQPTIYDETDASVAKITAFRCKWNCPAPVTDDGKETVERLWSDAKGWGGSIPGEGDYVIIEEHEIVTLDIDTASLGTLEIRGQLKFSDQVSSLTLTAKIIWVRGQLIAGTEETPYKNKAIINLTGSIVDEPIVVNFAVDAGTKVLVVTGKLSLVGQQVNTLTRLSASAKVNDKTITVEGDISTWQKGDQIVLAPSGMTSTEYESLIISSLDASKKTVTFETAIKYFHYGASSTFTTSNSKNVDMRTEVLHMTRNIQIQGTQESSLGGRVLITSEIGDSVVTGVAIMKYVALSYCGQSGTDRAGITFEYAPVGTGSKIYGCSIQKSFSSSIRFEQSNLITVSYTNIFNTQHYGIQFKDNNEDITITNNVIVGVKPNGRGPIVDLYDYSAGIVIYDSTNSGITISDNIAAGCKFSGFFIRAPLCTSTNFFTNNVAHSSFIGLAAYEDLKSCISISDFTAYRTSYGVQSYYRVNQIKATNLLLLDNIMGLNLASSSDGIRQITVTNSYFAGIALKSCPECYTLEQCSTQSAIGLGAFNNETRPDKFQFYRSNRDAVLGSSYQFSGNYFENYQDYIFGSKGSVPQCEANTIFKSSQFATDFIPYATITKSNIQNVDWNALGNFLSPYEGDWNCGPEVQCTLVLNSLVKDLDGSLSANAKKSAALLPTHSTVTVDSYCNWMASGFVCTESPYGLLGFKSLDLDKSKLVLDFITVVNSDFSTYNLINSHRNNNPREEGDTQQWTSVVKVGETYDVTFLHDMPVEMNFEYQGSSTSDSILVKMPYRHSKVVRVINSVTGKVASACTGVPPLAPAIKNTDACGTYIYDRAADTVQFKITGASDCKLTIQQTNSLVASIRFDITVEEFFQQGGFAPFIDKVAAVLNIPSYRIRVVGVYKGSTILEFAVDADSQGIGSSSLANAELANLSTILAAAVKKGTLNMYGAPVLNFNQEMIISEEDYGLGVSQKDPKTTKAVSGVKLWAIIIGIPVAVLLIGLFVLYKFKLRAGKKSGKRSNKSVVKIVPEMPTPKSDGTTPTSKFILAESSERNMFKDPNGNESRKHLASNPGSIGSLGALDDFTAKSSQARLTPTGGRRVKPLKTIKEKPKDETFNATIEDQIQNLE